MSHKVWRKIRISLNTEALSMHKTVQVFHPLVIQRHIANVMFNKIPTLSTDRDPCK